MSDERAQAAAQVLGGRLDWQSWYGTAQRVLQAADAADDHVRVPRETLRILQERAAVGDLGTVRARLNELLGGDK